MARMRSYVATMASKRTYSEASESDCCVPSPSDERTSSSDGELSSPVLHQALHTYGHVSRSKILRLDSDAARDPILGVHGQYCDQWKLRYIPDEKSLTLTRVAVFRASSPDHTRHFIMRVGLTGLPSNEWKRLCHISRTHASLMRQEHREIAFADLAPSIQNEIMQRLPNMTFEDVMICQIDDAEFYYRPREPISDPVAVRLFGDKNTRTSVQHIDDSEHYYVILVTRHTATGDEQYVAKLPLSKSDPGWANECTVAMAAYAVLGEFACCAPFSQLAASLQTQLLQTLKQEDLCRSRDVVTHSSVLFTRYYPGHATLREMIKSPTTNDPEFRGVILQVLVQLLRIRAVYPAFRHNDLHVGNIIITRLNHHVGDITAPGIGTFHLKTYLKASLIDFGYSQLYPQLEKNSVFNYVGLGVTGITPHVNPYYDHHTFLNAIWTQFNKELDLFTDFNFFFSDIVRDPDLMGIGLPNKRIKNYRISDNPVTWRRPVFSLRLSRYPELACNYLERTHANRGGQFDVADLSGLYDDIECTPRQFLIHNFPVIPETLDVNSPIPALDTTYIPTEEQMATLEETVCHPYFDYFSFTPVQ